MRKAQGLSLNMIVIAAVVLIVLVVAVAIFTGYFGRFVPGLQAATQRECTGDDYTTPLASQGCSESEVQVFGNFGDTLEPDEICCKKNEAKASLGGGSTDACAYECVDDGCGRASDTPKTGTCAPGKVCCQR